MTTARSDPPDSCEDEPIHIPGSIQPHGWLLAFSPDGIVRHASANLGALGGGDPARCIGGGLDKALPGEAAPLVESLLGWAAQPHGGFVRIADLARRRCRAFAHRAGDLLILEIEPAPHDPPGRSDTLQADVLDFSRAADALTDWRDLAWLATRAARRITGFDRVLIYRFDASWAGQVVAEDGSGALPSYEGRLFPASDIPAQAREMYRTNRLRLIPDASYQPVPILPDAGPSAAAPLDLRQAVLRSVSPLHLQYMRNMGTGASMSASLIVDGRLWGLLSCHHATPRRAGLPERSAVEFLAHMLSGGIAARSHIAGAQRLVEAQAHHDRLLATMAAASPPRPEILAEEPDDLLALAGAAGASIVTEADCLSVGQTPHERVVRDIAAWLHARRETTVFATDILSDAMPAAEHWTDLASGVLAISISELHPRYVIWFRPELIRTLDWAGEPEKQAGPEPGQLHPRLSFATWRQTVRRRSEPWAPHEVEAARRLRHAIVGVVLRRAEELAGVNRELIRSNKELEAFSYSISHDLRAPFRHIVGYAELLREHLGDRLEGSGARFLQTIVDSALSAGQLVDDLLQFSRLGRAPLMRSQVSMDKLVEEARRTLEIEAGGRAIEWRIGRLAPAWGDPSLLRQAMLNLLSNAVKYSRGRDPAVIEVFSETIANGERYTVRDNGTGFDMAYAGKLFGVFQRLHLAEHYEGTGIGLALTRRIVERHGGTITASGQPGAGAVFSFTLPGMEAGGGQPSLAGGQADV